MKTSPVNMATATSTKTKPASKAGANANPKQKTQMHRRSRTGLSAFTCTVFVTYTICRAHPGANTHAPIRTGGSKLTLDVIKDAIHAGYEGKSATRARPCALLASISVSSANTSDRCGGATTKRGGNTRTISR